MTVTAITATAAGFAADWSGSLEFWFGRSGGAHAVGDPSSPVNQSLLGMLARFGLNGTGQAIGWAAVVPVLGVVAASGIRRALRADAVPLAVVITAGFGLVVSPISWGHHWVYVVPAIVVLVAYGLRPGHRHWLPAAAALAVVGHAAPFLALDLDSQWLPVRLVSANSYVLTGVTLLTCYGAPAVVRRCAVVLAGLAARARRLPAVPPLGTGQDRLS